MLWTIWDSNNHGEPYEVGFTEKEARARLLKYGDDFYAEDEDSNFILTHNGPAHSKDPSTCKYCNKGLLGVKWPSGSTRSGALKLRNREQVLLPYIKSYMSDPSPKKYDDLMYLVIALLDISHEDAIEFIYRIRNIDDYPD